MSSVLATPAPNVKIPRSSWATVAWCAVLLAICYAPIIKGLIRNWTYDEDMGHAFFVPVIAAFIAWQKLPEIAGKQPRPNWWGLAIMIIAALQLYLATLGAELFLARTSLAVSIIGMVLLLGGVEYLRVFAFPIFLLFFMVRIPEIVYNSITFPLQILASKAAENALSLLQIPVLREGNILELANQKLNVVEACSGIRSLLSLSFLSLVYGYFFEKKIWIRVALFLATVPIAIIANAGRVTITGILHEYKPELAAGFYHSAEGWVIFMAGLVTMIGFHQLLVRAYSLIHAKH